MTLINSRTSFVEDFTSEAREKTSLFTYSIYVWGITSVYFVLAVMALYYFYGTTTPWCEFRVDIICWIFYINGWEEQHHRSEFCPKASRLPFFSSSLYSVINSEPKSERWRCHSLHETVWLLLCISASLRYQLFKVTSVYVWLVIDKGFLLCNAYLYFSTAFTIERLKKESRGPMVDGVNNRHIFAEKWWVKTQWMSEYRVSYHCTKLLYSRLNLYVQLYCLMGIGTIITLYAIAVPFSMFTMYSACVAAVKALCCGLIFKIFVLKDDIRRSFTEQFTKGMRKLGLIRPRHSTTSTENISTRL